MHYGITVSYTHLDVYKRQSHGHSIVAKAMGSFPQIYPGDNMELDADTVFTNKPSAGAMRGYGMPQASFADDANIDECARAVHKMCIRDRHWPRRRAAAPTRPRRR